VVLYKYVPAERIDILQNRLIRFTQPSVLNDPFEAHPYFYALGTKEKFAEAFADMIRRAPYCVWKDYKNATRTNLDRSAFTYQLEADPDYAGQLCKNLGHRDILPNLRERFYKLHNMAGILSLSETPNNLLMWSHYAAGHTGLVLVLDGTHDFFKSDISLHGFAKPEPVEYRSERPCMTAKETSEEAALQKIFFIKGSDWKYEKEWRYLKILDEADKRFKDANSTEVSLFRLPPKCVIGIILGCYRSQELENQILTLQHEAPEFSHLKIQKTRTSGTHYHLEIAEIDA